MSNTMSLGQETMSFRHRDDLPKCLLRRRLVGERRRNDMSHVYYDVVWGGNDIVTTSPCLLRRRRVWERRRNDMSHVYYDVVW